MYVNSRDVHVQYRRSVLPFTKKADILMVVYDITNILSFKYLPDILEQIISSGTTPWMSMVLVGNKLDLDREPGSRQVSSDMAFDLCRRYGFGLNFETSAKTGINVTELLSVALSRCEQDRLRELNFVPLTEKGIGLVENGHKEAQEPSFAQSIANFFGLGGDRGDETNQRYLGDRDSDIRSTRAGASEDDARTAYSSRFGPMSTYSNNPATQSDYQVVRRAVPHSMRGDTSVTTSYVRPPARAFNR